MPSMSMAQGPKPEHAAQCKDKAEFYSLLAKFYLLSAKKQRVFLAMFDALLEED